MAGREVGLDASGAGGRQENTAARMWKDVVCCKGRRWTGLLQRSVDLCWTILDYVVCCSAKRCTDQGWMLKCYALQYRMLIHVEFCSMECRICCGIRCRHILVMLDVGKYCILHHQIKKIYDLMLLYRTLQRRTIKHFRYNLNHIKTNVCFGIK